MAKKNRLYWKAGRAYGDFRDLNGKREALIDRANGDKLAVTDPDVAVKLLNARREELESERRGIALIGRGKEELLAPYAQHHLERKAQLSEVTDFTLATLEHHLERAVEFFGEDRPLAQIDVTAVQDWAVWLREKFGGRRGRAAVSDGTVRHHLNALSNLFRRAMSENKVRFNPVMAWDRKPRGKPQEARWLEPHEAALLLAACRTYQPPAEYRGLPDLHAIVATFLLTGGRYKEVMGLAVDDVNFERRTITFRPHPWHKGERLKTDGSSRVVPMWPQLEKILRAYVEAHAPTRLLFPSSHRRVLGGSEKMLTDIRGALDAAAATAGWAPGEIRTKAFRHTYTSARLQTLDQGAPVSVFTAARELGHGGESLVRRIYGHLGTVRNRAEVVEFVPAVLKQIENVTVRRQFKARFDAVTNSRKLKIA